MAVVGIGVAGAVARSSERTTTTIESEPTLAEVRQLTERFRDVKVALAEGYIRDPSNICETAEMMGRPAALGAMGIHYFRPDLLGSRSMRRTTSSLISIATCGSIATTRTACSRH